MTTTSSYYVHRLNPTTGREGWVGPIRSAKQAAKEVDAWQSCDYEASLHPSNPDVKAAVRAWMKSVKS